MKKTLGNAVSFLTLLLVIWSVLPVDAFAQDAENIDAPLEGLPTLISVRLSGGYGLGRARQLYGYNGGDGVYWSTGQGLKMNLALDIPIVPIEVVNIDSQDIGYSKTPVVALELEAATGYHLSSGGTTVDPMTDGSLTTTNRTTAYVPITLGLNARSSFGAGLPSVYIGAGGGVYLVALYQEDVSNTKAPTSNFTRKMTPPLPFGLYGALGFELPVMYSPEDGNSFMDLFAEVRLTEMTSYVYNYTVTQANSGSVTTVSTLQDPQLLYLHESERSASSLAISVGIKFNIY